MLPWRWLLLPARSNCYRENSNFCSAQGPGHLAQGTRSGDQVQGILSRAPGPGHLVKGTRSRASCPGHLVQVTRSTAPGPRLPVQGFRSRASCPGHQVQGTRSRARHQVRGILSWASVPDFQCIRRVAAQGIRSLAAQGIRGAAARSQHLSQGNPAPKSRDKSIQGTS